MALDALIEPLAPDAVRLAHPYPPSWVDRLIAWVRRLPLPGWVFYFTLWLAIATLVTVSKWLDGTYPAGRLYAQHALFAGYGVWCLAMIHYLNWQAARVLREAHPALDVDEAQYRRLHYQLTVMPARGAALFSLALAAVFTVVAIIFLPTFRVLADIAHSPLSFVVDIALVNTFNFAAFGALIYHTIHQLRMVDRVYKNHARINVYLFTTLHAFSRLTLATALGYILVPYLTVLASPQMAANPLVIGVLVFNAIVAAATFTVPLMGMHDLMRNEKERAQLAADERLEDAADELHRRVDAVEYHGMDDINKAILSLVAERDVLHKMPTWPWEPGTLRALITALSLPLAVWIIQKVLQTWFGL